MVEPRVDLQFTSERKKVNIEIGVRRVLFRISGVFVGDFESMLTIG